MRYLLISAILIFFSGNLYLAKGECARDIYLISGKVNVHGVTGLQKPVIGAKVYVFFDDYKHPSSVKNFSFTNDSGVYTVKSYFRLKGVPHDYLDEKGNMARVMPGDCIGKPTKIAIFITCRGYRTQRVKCHISELNITENKEQLPTIEIPLVELRRSNVSEEQFPIIETPLVE